MDETVATPLTQMQERARKIARGGGAIFATSLLVKGTTVLASILIARILGPYQLGEWSLVTYVTGFVYLFIDLGMGMAAVRMISASRTRDPERAEAIARTYVRFELLISIPILVFTGAIAPFLALYLYGDSRLLPLFWLGIATMFVWTLSACYAAVLQSYERIRILARLSLAFGIVSAGLLVVFVLLWGLIGGFVASLVANAVQLAVYIRVVRTPQLLSGRVWHLDIPILREMLFYGLPTFGAAAFLIAFNWIGASVVASQIGLQNLGDFTVAQRLSFVIMYVPTAIVVPFFPMASGLYEQDRAGFARTFQHALRYTLMIVFPLTLAFAAMSRVLITLVYGDAYLLAASLVPVTAAAALLSAFLSPATLVFYVTGAMRSQFALSAVVFALSVGLLLILTPMIGILGFAWALYAFYAATAVLAPHFLRRHFSDSHFRNAVVVASGLSLLVVFAGSALLALDLYASILVGATLVGVTLLTTYFLVMTAGDRLFLRRMMREMVHARRPGA